MQERGEKGDIHCMGVAVKASVAPQDGIVALP